MSLRPWHNCGNNEWRKHGAGGFIVPMQNLNMERRQPAQWLVLHRHSICEAIAVAMESLAPATLG